MTDAKRTKEIMLSCAHCSDEVAESEAYGYSKQLPLCYDCQSAASAREEETGVETEEGDID